MVEMRRIYSSHIDSVGYDPDAQNFHVRYSNGSEVVYAGVPSDVAHQVLTSGSIGSAIWRSVRGKFDHSYQARAPRRK